MEVRYQRLCPSDNTVLHAIKSIEVQLYRAMLTLFQLVVVDIFAEVNQKRNVD